MTVRALRAGFSAWGCRWRLIRIERGKRGEARTMYIIKRESDGHAEARARADVLAAATP
jgi:hypothetical protein